MSALGLRLREFSSQHGDVTLHYHVLPLTGSVYVWVGTDTATLNTLIAAMDSRVGPPALSTLLGPGGEESHGAGQVAGRLQQRCKRQLLLSLNLPSADLLPLVEQRLAEELCVA